MKDYKEINRQSWNNRTAVHIDSDFYNVPSFLKGATSLKSIELGMLGNIRGKRILHLQCHFGQDTISLARMGAHVTGVDLSDVAIDKARGLAKEAGVECTFIASDVYDLPAILKEDFDIVFTSYGVIGWLPDMNKWAGVIANFLRPKGQLVFVEFHPVVWMFDDDFNEIKYRYFNSGEIRESEEGTYADTEAHISQEYVMWNHGMSEVVNNLISHGMNIRQLDEYDYSPYPCFRGVVEVEKGKFRIEKMKDNIPMVYAILAEKTV
ncbi:MAG: class I SAM-dependent methyltransferase [Flavobacteriales bacterium]|nr:class I SAM-dependent methyltransferase [Flavobacteriales bacterium]MDG2245511.1 class I SAM-dependent methyltransferase [Flavobacteriales bacterium]